MRNDRPLADLIRPKTFADLVGHSDVLGEQGLIGRMVKDNTYRSFVMWGPPGIGKTTIARLIGNKDGSTYREVSAYILNGFRTKKYLLM